MHVLDRHGLALLMRDLAGEYDLYAPRRVGETLALQRLAPPEPAAPDWNAYRLGESLKGLWFQPAKMLASWENGVGRDRSAVRPRAVFGVKACDLRALQILDRVFRDHDYREPAWCDAREKHLIVAGDCTAHGASCFCTMLGDDPWAEGGFDLNLSPVADGYLAESGSERGSALLAARSANLREATAAEIEERDRRRNEVRAAVQRENERFPVREPFATSVGKNRSSRLWGELAATCVECNGCNLACPTCHCFLLRDLRGPNGSATRVSLWDSCFSAGYARMAGGGTPRLQLVERFRNHYFHKFVTFPQVWGATACTGCGRCIDACMGRIDKRRCLHELETRWIPSEQVAEVG